MLIKHWMTNNVVTATPETSVVKANKLMKDHNIRRLPVVDEQMRVIGIVSDRDIKDATPSQATSLDMREMLYLLSELKLQSIMTPNPICVNPDDSIEIVAMLMEEKGFGGFPVTKDGKLVGIISDHDIFRVLISLTGVRQGGILLALPVQDSVGVLRPILDTLAENNVNIISILSDNEDRGNNERHVFIRISNMATREEEQTFLDLMQKKHNLLYWSSCVAS